MTTELLIYGAALLILFFSVQAGAKAGAFAALSCMLGSVFSLLVTLRYWFLICRAGAAYQSASLPILAALCFWLPFIVILFLFLKLREAYIQEFESTATSFLGGALGALFGGVSGAVFAAALILTASLLSPESFATEKAGALPIALDSVPAVAFRYLEKNLAGVDTHDPAHTLLPKGHNAGQTPATFWQ